MYTQCPAPFSYTFRYSSIPLPPLLLPVYPYSVSVTRSIPGSRSRPTLLLMTSPCGQPSSTQHKTQRQRKTTTHRLCVSKLIIVHYYSIDFVLGGHTCMYVPKSIRDKKLESLIDYYFLLFCPSVHQAMDGVGTHGGADGTSPEPACEGGTFSLKHFRRCVHLLHHTSNVLVVLASSKLIFFYSFSKS